MATEDDKTNTGIAGTAIAVGVAAMIASSTALVGMARTQMDEVSQATQAYADLSSVSDLVKEQGARLTGAKVSIDKARQLTLSALKGDPGEASPWSVRGAAATPEPAGAATTAPSAEASSAPAASGDGASTMAPAADATTAGATQAPTAGSH